MKLKIVLIVVALVVLGVYLADRIFKVNYPGKNVATVENLKLNEKISLDRAYIVLGRNYKGVIEATVFPGKEQRYSDKGIVEYYYLRFHPRWFQAHVNPRITGYLSEGDKLGQELLEKAKAVHDQNFSYCCHFNDFPLVNEGEVFTRISVLGVADKITMLTTVR